MLEAPPGPLRVVTRGAEMRAAIEAERRRGGTIGLAPTMGALHEGHLSLVDAAARECTTVAASIFVNPTQFGAGEDFSRYPRTLDRDLELLASRGCRLVFAPEAAEMYPPGFDTCIDVGAVAVPWEGAARPGHFRGVATVVNKLFQLAPADRAYFGRKDYQQTLVVQRMVADLNLPIDVRVCPIVRDADGLALSSRNAYLSDDERRRAGALFRSLALAESMYAAGERSAATIRDGMRSLIGEVGGVEIEYIAIVADGGVDEVEELSGPTTIAVAARVGTTRLIDNCLVGAPG
jgi:pantoate--beta-alanine ligase